MIPPTPAPAETPKIYDELERFICDTSKLLSDRQLVDWARSKYERELAEANAEIEALKHDIERHIAILSEREWRGIESAPRDGTRILVWTINEEIELSDYFKLSYFEYQEVGNGLYKKIESVGPEGWNSNPFTKWHPLPPPPGGEGER